MPDDNASLIHRFRLADGWDWIEERQLMLRKGEQCGLKDDELLRQGVPQVSLYTGKPLNEKDFNFDQEWYDKLRFTFHADTRVQAVSKIVSDIQRKMEAIIPGDRNDETIRLFQFDKASSPPKMFFQISSFREYLASNLAAFLARRDDTAQSPEILFKKSECAVLETLFDPPKQLPNLHESLCANHLGINGLIVSTEAEGRNGDKDFAWTFLYWRGRGGHTFPDSLSPRPATVWRAAEDMLLNGKPSVFHAARSAFQNEWGIDTDVSHLRHLWLIGITRELCRAGKPEMFFVAKSGKDAKTLIGDLIKRKGGDRSMQFLVPVLIAANDSGGSNAQFFDGWLGPRMPRHLSPPAETALWLLRKHLLESRKDQKNGPSFHDAILQTNGPLQITKSPAPG